jgi:hypothetical protein
MKITLMILRIYMIVLFIGILPTILFCGITLIPWWIVTGKNIFNFIEIYCDHMDYIGEKIDF